ncbi:hypothetical protein O8I49_02725 [Campylobacter lari]|uniref:hypothetical protein n=1 Tax=Campylobacter lari TaxID=201 RepID=UPI0017CA00F1|nr:hypothetical protein [Campylobacter lari]
MKEIKVFLDKLQSWNKYFKITDYQHDKYDCEISDFFKMSLEVRENKLDFSDLLEYWRNIFSKDYFELYHPIYNNVRTRAVKNFFAPKKYPRFSNYIFFIDENNQHPWILCQVYDFFQFLVTEEGIFSNPISNRTMAKESIRDIERLPLAIKEFIVPSDLFYKNIKFGWLLRKNRPAHHFYEDIPSYYALDIKKPIYKKDSFFTPKDAFVSDSKNNVNIYPGIFRSLGEISNRLYYQSNQKVFLESVDKVKENNNRDILILWLQLPGERRKWLEQVNGVKDILFEVKKYFKTIKIFFDGMTSYENVVNSFDENFQLYNEIKFTISDPNIEIISMIGKDYRTKISYCSCTDLALCEMGTALLVPHSFCNKKIVAYYGYEEYENAGCDNPNKIRKVSKKYIKVVDFVDKFIFNYHIPFQHLYNLLADTIEEIKDVKMHRLEVPSVDLVADCYELEQKYKMKFPIEYVVSYNEYKNILNCKTEQLLCEIQKFQNTQDDINKKNESFFAMIQEKELKYNQILEEKYQYQISKLVLDNKIIKQQNQHLLKKINENNCFVYLKENESAKLRVREHLAYKLGQAMIINSKSLLGYIKMPFVFHYIKVKHKQEQMLYKQKILENPALANRPLEDYPDYNEAIKEKECLTYKLGEALIKADKDWYKGGYVIFLLKIIKFKISNKMEDMI